MVETEITGFGRTLIKYYTEQQLCLKRRRYYQRNKALFDCSASKVIQLAI